MLIKILKRIRSNLSIILIVTVAFVLRVSQTSFLPPALNWDEVSHGYNAYSILKTGRDEWGKTFPIIFRAYGDYKLPVYIYLTVISEFFFGLSELAVRLPSILAGTLSVLFTYLLVRKLFTKNSLALIAAFLMAIEPWSLFTSRIAVEANVAVFLIITGVFFFLKGTRNFKFLILSIIFLGLSVWTYNSARIFVPFLLVSLLLIYKDGVMRLKKRIAYLALPFAIFFLPMFYQLVSPSGIARYSWVEILDDGSSALIVENRAKIALPAPFPRLISNKATFFVGKFVTNYFSHFSPDFLFFKGGSNYQFSLPGHGLLYLVGLPFFIFGLVVSLKNYGREKWAQLILFWLVLAPIPSSLTRESPHALRALVILPLPMLITGLGLHTIYNWLEKRKVGLVFVVIYAVFILAGVENYAKDLVFNYRPNYSWSWQFGYKEVVSYVKDNYDKYDRIVMTKKYGEPHEFILFSWPWEPSKYMNDKNLVRFYQSNWHWVDSFDKFFFINDWQIPKTGQMFIAESKNELDCSELKCLFVTSPGNVPLGWNKLETVNFLDGKPAFEILEN